MILLAYRHGLRASELCAARWDMIDLAQGRYHVTRRKNGRPSVHVIRGSEIRALRRLKREQTPPSPYVFTTERKAPVTPAGFRMLLTAIGEAAALPFPAHRHDRCTAKMSCEQSRAVSVRLAVPVRRRRDADNARLSSPCSRP